MRVVISDASPLIHLASLGRLPLLRSLYQQVIVPTAVWTEVTQAGAQRLGAGDLRTAQAEGWVDVRAPKLFRQRLCRRINSTPANATRLCWLWSFTQTS
jgi:predicted nucleic acid-binding protein